jgi:trans-2,3-dihydro-3-hydroxyanthranilate isomerase
VQVCGAGRIGVRFDGDLVELVATPRDLLGPLDGTLTDQVLGLVGLSSSDLAGEVWVAGCGLSFVHLPVTEEAVGRARPVAGGFGGLGERLADLGVRDLVDAVNVHAVTGGPERLDVHARVFVPGAGVPEDAATGSSAAGLGMALVASGRLPEGGRYDIRQGAEMGRPSLLQGRVEASAGRATRCSVAGRVQPVASGHIRVPR